MQHRPRLTMEQALAKMHRRRALWHAVYMTTDPESFRANLGTIQDAIAKQLIREFGRP